MYLWKAKSFGKTRLKEENLEGTKHVEGKGCVEEKYCRLGKVENEFKGGN